MKRWGSGDRFLALLDRIRTAEPDAAFRSSFIVGFPGETERDHDELLAFLDTAHLDWAGFFPYSREDGTAAATLDGEVDVELMHERLRECADVQDPITRGARHALVGRTVDVLVDRFGDDDADGPVGRSAWEAPEIDGLVRLEATTAAPGEIVPARITGTLGTDLVASGLG